MNDFNKQVVDEFRANAGVVGGYFDGKDMALLTTTGAKSGETRLVPLVYFPDGDRIFIVASKSGAPNHPDWYHNLLANPSATVEIGTESFQVKPRVLEEPERSEKYAHVVEVLPGFGDYEKNTTRVIPVLELVRI